MKIALCLSGQPRFLDEGYAQIYKHLLSKYSVDCFIHTWWSDDMVGKNINVMGVPDPHNRSYVFPHNTLDILFKHYDPIAFVYEPQKNFLLIEGVNFEKLNSTSVQSMWYSIKMANQLKTEHEKINGFVYDIVIRCRTDIIIDRLVLANLTKSNCVYTASVGAERDFPNDQLAVSSSSGMNYYASLYDNLIMYKDEGFVGFIGERLLRYHMSKSEIELCLTSDIINDLHKYKGV